MIKVTLLLSIVLLAVPQLRRRSAAERHLIWSVTLAVAALLPLLSILLPSWEPEWARQVIDLLPPSLVRDAPAPDGPAADIVVRANTVESLSWTFQQWWWLAWALGSSVATFRLVAGARKLALVTSGARAIDDARLRRIAVAVASDLGLRKTIRLLHITDIMPMAWGVLHPCVLLPSSAFEWSDERARAVLAHELAHIRRDDWIVHMLAELVCATYWFHPLFWTAKHRLCRESEHAADDEVIGLGLDRGAYAIHLLQVVRAARAAGRARSPAAVAMARSSGLEQRFIALLDDHVNRNQLTHWTIQVAATLAATMSVPVAAIAVADVTMAIDIRPTSLPPLVESAASFPREAPSAVRMVRAVDVPNRATGIMEPEIVEYTTPPLYSDEARQQRVEGVVRLRARVTEDGEVRNVQLLRGLGFGLDQNAAVAFRQWRFRPGTVAGRAVAMNVEIDIEFSLRNEALNEVIANDMATRVGPGVTPPRAIRVFTLRQWRPSKHGTVVLDVVLLEDGTPKIVRILHSVDPTLDDSAVRTFEQWRFSPAMKGGRPIRVRMNAEVRF